MKNILMLSALLLVAGCATVPVEYKEVETPRVDTKITGNKGCLSGTCEKINNAPKKKLGENRLISVWEVEIKNKESKVVSKKDVNSDADNSIIDEANADLEADKEYAEKLKSELNKKVSAATTDEPVVEYKKEYEKVSQDSSDLKTSLSEEAEHVVANGETLQKISMKYYGTTKKYLKIYEANKDKLSSPNAVRPGQKLKIPA